MSIKFDPKNSTLNISDRLRCTKQGIYREEKKPFFLIHVIRRILGQYNHTRLHDKINLIATDMLQHPEKSTLAQWQHFKNNFEVINVSYRKTEHLELAKALHQRIETKLSELLRIHQAAAAPAPLDKNSDKYPGLGKDYLMDDNGNYYFLNPDVAKAHQIPDEDIHPKNGSDLAKDQQIPDEDVQPNNDLDVAKDHQSPDEDISPKNDSDNVTCDCGIPDHVLKQMTQQDVRDHIAQRAKYSQTSTISRIQRFFASKLSHT